MGSEFLNESQEGAPQEAAPQSGRPDFSSFDAPKGQEGAKVFGMLTDPDNPFLLDLTDLVPQEQRVPNEPAINVFLRALVNSGGSDLHLSYNVPPVLRVHGNLKPVKFKMIPADTMKKMIFQILSPQQRELCENGEEVDACYTIEGVGRFRMNIFHQLYGLAAVFRAIPIRVKTIDEVGISEDIAKLALHGQGFVIVTGATGSGKSTTLAALIDYVNKNDACHIVTIEDPLEFVHTNYKSIVTHREVGAHTNSFSNALRAALRQDPDVILLGELRDLLTIEIALTAAETGHMVFGTLHTNNASETISRIISVFPADRQQQIAMQLSTVLTAIIAQELMPSKDGKGRVPIREILVGTNSVRAMIRDGKIPQIYSAIETGKKLGMRTMKETVEEAERLGKISADVAKERIAELAMKQ